MMEGQFVVMDGNRVVAGVFADDISAEEYRKELLALPDTSYDNLEVRAACPECGEHPEEPGGVCTDVLRRVLAGLRRA